MKLRRRTFLAACLALTPGVAMAQYQPQARDLIERLRALQADDGAILLPGAGPERGCDPHAANLAVLGVLVGAPPRQRGEATGMARKWLDWAAARWTTDGLQSVYTGAPGMLKASGSADRTAVVAATFLAAVTQYYAATSEGATVERWKPALQKARETVRGLRQDTRLYFSGPDRREVRLADNAEVWHGLHACARLFEQLRDEEMAEAYDAEAKALVDAMDKWLWDQRLGHYSWSLQADGSRNSGLERWEPVRANLMAVALLPSARRRADLQVRLAESAGPLPERIETEEQLERVLWWGMATLPWQSPSAMERYQLLLSKVKWEALRSLSPALLGYALRVGSGRVTAYSPPFELEMEELPFDLK